MMGSLFNHAKQFVLTSMKTRAIGYKEVSGYCGVSYAHRLPEKSTCPKKTQTRNMNTISPILDKKLTACKERDRRLTQENREVSAAQSSPRFSLISDKANKRGHLPSESMRLMRYFCDLGSPVPFGATFQNSKYQNPNFQKLTACCWRVFVQRTCFNT